MVTSNIPKGVTIQRDMLGNINKLLYEEHDFVKFPSFNVKNYMEMLCSTDGASIYLENMEWTLGFERFGIFLLMHITHFGRIVEVNTCVKKLLHCMQGGFMWIDMNISIDLNLITQITGLPKPRVDPPQFFVGKERDRELAIRIKNNYNLSKNFRGYDVASIKDEVVCFVEKELAIKVLRKCHSNQVPTLIIYLVAQCAKDVQMNWENFLLNEFLNDFEIPMIKVYH